MTDGTEASDPIVSSALWFCTRYRPCVLWQNLHSLCIHNIIHLILIHVNPNHPLPHEPHFQKYHMQQLASDHGVDPDGSFASRLVDIHSKILLGPLISSGPSATPSTPSHEFPINRPT